MPLISVRTSANSRIESELLLSELSSNLASLTGKPESYVMVILEPNIMMTFAGNSDPCAFVDIKSIGSLSPGEMSSQFSQIISRNSDIPINRIYLNFEDVAASSWGYNGKTFG